jgi:hypothetical protein
MQKLDQVLSQWLKDVLVSFEVFPSKAFSKCDFGSRRTLRYDVGGHAR